MVTEPLSPTPRTWSIGRGTPIDLHFPSAWAPYEVCVAVTNYQRVKRRSGQPQIVLFVAGTLMANSRWFYAISEEEFSSADPTQELGQLSAPVLSPAEPYELNAPGTQTQNTIWMNDIMFDGGSGECTTAPATRHGSGHSPLRPAASPPPPGTEFSTASKVGSGFPTGWTASTTAAGPAAASPTSADTAAA